MTKAKTKEREPALSHDRVRKVLAYDAVTGIFTRRIAIGNQKIGSVAGWLCKNGYVYVDIDGKRYLGQRLAFLYMTGSFPPSQADHKNGIRSDNRWDNLRTATPKQNAQNVKHHRDNRSGFKGISFHTSPV